MATGIPFLRACRIEELRSYAMPLCRVGVGGLRGFCGGGGGVWWGSGSPIPLPRRGGVGLDDLVELLRLRPPEGAAAHSQRALGRSSTSPRTCGGASRAYGGPVEVRRLPMCFFVVIVWCVDYLCKRVWSDGSDACKRYALCIFAGDLYGRACRLTSDH